MDVHNQQQRSKNMAAIKASATKDEVRLAKALWHRGHRYRKNNPKVFGKPDLTFKKYKLAIFVDSEFFHGKDFETKKKPVNNAEFWEKKIARNIERDKEVNEYLNSQGWTVLRFWTTEIKKDLESVIQSIEKQIVLKKIGRYKRSDDEAFPLAAEP